MRGIELRMGLVDGKAIKEIQRPLELDLEAAFKAMRDDVTREMIAAINDGATPDEVIRRVDAILAED
jgi:hypothetical protein